MRTLVGLWCCLCWEILNVVAIGTTNSPGNTTENPCDVRKSKTLDKCWSQIPPLADTGIPSSPEAVASACKAFDTGMTCVEDWAKRCLDKEGQEKIKSSVSGAHETFTFLCREQKFREEYLKHADCYKKISHLWDDCARQFIENLKKYNDAKDEFTICCIKIRFLQCVTDVAHYHCNKEAAKFLQKMAETLVRSTMRSNSQSKCLNLTYKNCTMVNSAPSASCKFSFLAKAKENYTIDSLFTSIILSIFSWDYIFRFVIVCFSTVYLVCNAKWV